LKYVHGLQSQIMTLLTKNAQLQKQLEISKEKLRASEELSQELITSQTIGAIGILSKKIKSQIQHKNLPPKVPFLSVSIDWVDGFEKLLILLPFGTLIQPLPDYRADSMVTIRRFSTVNELEQLFPERLRRNFIDGGWAILEPPFELKWSKTTNKLSARFTYTSYLSSGVPAYLTRSFKGKQSQSKDLNNSTINLRYLQLLTGLTKSK